jgi:hypothetical protein
MKMFGGADVHAHVYLTSAMAAPAALPSRKQPLVYTRQEAWWDQKSFCTKWRGEKTYA